ncbi:LAME_0F03180g1_1 [Lachancea meyersii CBS 8951]|uniref:LAME_0F03180g1_1 n=1 Tax=Lachancea meyersii CBS 8951 TaxID=1266667 RepID=A0A1G4JR18_9SACH|nr:LAME_0F03180g1_1 [Lachancea meyersii CBS 8951]
MTEAYQIDEAEVQNQIRQFSSAALRQRSGNFPRLKRSRDGSVFPATDGATTNRGNKLLQNSEGVKRTSLRNHGGSRDSHVFYNGSVHKLLARNRRGDEAYDDDEDNSCSADLHELVNVRQILAPISSLEDIAKHPAISKTFQSSVLGELALQAVLMIKKEQSNVVSFSKLLEAFLGDYPGPLVESKLKLEEYDHNLKLQDDAALGDETVGDAKAQQQLQPLKSERDSIDGDPFFALPQFDPLSVLPTVISRKQDSTTEEVEAARQLAQIALQRNQEFIRNLQKIRNCIVKAQRIKERISMWGREYAGIPEEGLTVPNALHVVKRGLISATTNRTMTEKRIDAEAKNEDDSERPS